VPSRLPAPERRQQLLATALALFARLGYRDASMNDIGRIVSPVIVRGQIEKVAVFAQLTQFLREKEEHKATREQALSKLAELIPNENNEQTFATLVQWGRYAELFGYNDDSKELYLDVGQETV
jgi:NitT/TauT family transport system ATP-binding protein